MIALTSSAGLIALLDDPDQKIQEYSLKKLNEVIDQFWAEISDAIEKIEILYEDQEFKSRNLAALVASKVYYHLGEYEDSLNFALGAGEAFDVSSNSEYAETIISKCIHRYIKLRVQQFEGDMSASQIDPRLESIARRMFKRCFEDEEYKQAIGIALESRDLDILKEALAQCGNLAETLQYTLGVAMNLVMNKQFRKLVLRVLVDLFETLPEPDYESACRCLVFLNDPEQVVTILKRLLANEADVLTLYQIGFDLYENATQHFLKQVMQGLPGGPKPKAAASSEAPAPEAKTEPEEQVSPVAKKLQSILSGEISIGLNMEFLFRNNKTDLILLNNIKGSVDARYSILHSSTLFANSLMHAGTTVDNFLRLNLDWLGKATNWAKFSATAGLGVIHKGHLSQGLKLLAPYLPRPGVTGSPYSEGGALYALGLIHANHGKDVVPNLTAALKAAQNETVQHGACLGLGVAAMATDDEEIFEDLKAILFSDSAVAGEAAGLAMGLVMLGTGSTKAVEEMIQYAHETQHEKIIRGLATGISLVMYGAEEDADALIERLCSDKDPILRYGGMFTIAMAYVGTANNKAIRKLLHVAVSDVSDEVRRASVISLGFLLFKNPEQCPRLVELLAESYNPHVRYGATLALGISCAGTGLTEAISMLEPLTTDRTDFVRQGAMLALSMILIQHNEQMSPKVTKFRKQFEKVVSEKHEDALCKFGAILAQGILDAGGRNVTISLKSRAGNPRMSAIVGLLIFTQFWYWYPLVHMISLAFTPTAVIGLNKDLKMPNLEFVSNIKPSAFAYPPATTPPANEKLEKVSTAVLSTTAKAKARKEKKDRKNDMPIDRLESTASTAATTMEVDEKPKEKPQPKKEKEAKFETLSNPARVLPAQLKYLSIKKDSRYVPIKKDDLFGILLLRNTQPEQEESFVTATVGTGVTKVNDEGEEPGPPQPFEYPFDD